MQPGAVPAGIVFTRGRGTADIGYVSTTYTHRIVSGVPFPRLVSGIVSLAAGGMLGRLDRFTAIAMIRSGDLGVVRKFGAPGLLVRHPDVHVRQYLASRGATPHSCKYQEVLAADSAKVVRSTLARCAGFVCPSTLTELALDDEVAVRLAVAGREDLPVLVWDLLARDVSPTVRARVAANAAVPDQVLRLLCSDEASPVREMAMHHPRVSADGQVEVALRGGA